MTASTFRLVLDIELASEDEFVTPMVVWALREHARGLEAMGGPPTPAGGQIIRYMGDSRAVRIDYRAKRMRKMVLGDIIEDPFDWYFTVHGTGRCGEADCIEHFGVDGRIGLPRVMVEGDL